MNKHLLFLHGGASEKDYEADAKLVASLEKELGNTYQVHYPFLPQEPVPDLGRKEQIEKELALIKGEVILVAHSFGASSLLKFLSENETKSQIAGVFLIATPFWSGDEDWKRAFKLPADFAEKLPKHIPIFFYHCTDDDEVPFSHFTTYQQKLPSATFRSIKSGGHQLDNNLAPVANDIKTLEI